MAEQLRVMISSTARDLPEHREKVKDACMSLGMFFPDMMEHLNATDANALDVSLRIVDRADLYVGIFAFRYGYVPPGQTISVTEAEYNRAVEKKIPRLVFLMSHQHPVLPGAVETGSGAELLEKFKARLKEERVVAFFDSASDLEAEVSRALFPYSRKGSPDSGEAQPLIHTLPTHRQIEGREQESAAVLRAMSAGDERVYAFAAPGGFGKTALLSKVVRGLSSDDRGFAEKVTLADGAVIEPRIGALLHVDCRNEVKLSRLFADAGRLIGQEQAFTDIYNAEAPLSERLHKILRLLTEHATGRVWFVFDNFESTLNDRAEVANQELREFFSAIFAGGHDVHALVASRDIPRFSPREQAKELEVVGTKLFEGLPADDCLSFLRKNGAAKSLTGSTDEIDAVLRKFSERVQRIPLALVWAVGYLRDTDFTLKQILERDELFAEFDREQTKEAERYENKGLKRLHYEQLKMQRKETLPVLRLLAFFKTFVPKGALAHLLDEVELNKTLRRVERNKLVNRKESADAHTRYVDDPLAVNLYGLHLVICENEFFDAFSDNENLYETAAEDCGRRAGSAYDINRFAYALELFECAEKLYEHLTNRFNREDLMNSFAGTLMNKGNALQKLTGLNVAIEEYDKAIAIRERLVNVEQQAHLANDLAMAYMNKGNALQNLTRLNEAIAEYDKAIAIREQLVNVEQQVHLANDLAMAYLNKGVALVSLTRLDEAIAEYDKAIAIREQLVNVERQVHLANDLAMAYMNKGNALAKLTRLNEAIEEYDQAIAIQERLVNVEQQAHLANDLAMAYLNKGVALRSLTRSNEAIAEYDKAIAIQERLVNVERQAHLANNLAMAYMNKGNVLQNLTRLNEAIEEYDKAIGIQEQLVNVEQQAHLADDLAMAYMNKGNALQNLARLNDAVEEYDKAIAIRERLVSVEQQAHLANTLATVYLNKALALERLADFDGSLIFYDRGLQARRFCVEQLSMFWIIPELLKSLRCRLITLLKLKRWRAAAEEVLELTSRFTTYDSSEKVPVDLKKAAGEEFNQMISHLRAMSLEQRELLYAELGDKAAGIRSLVDG